MRSRLLIALGLASLCCQLALAAGAPAAHPAAASSAPAGGGGSAARGGSASSSAHQSSRNTSSYNTSATSAAARANNANNANNPNNRIYNRFWACADANGNYYTSGVPCLDYRQLHPESEQTVNPRSGQRFPGSGEAGGQGGVNSSALNWAADAWAAGLPTHPQPLAPPILTNQTDQAAHYAIVLRGGSAFVTMEAPKQTGTRVVGRDRSGRLYSIKASEVDFAASHLPVSHQEAPAPKPR